MRITLLGTGTSTGIPVIGCSCRVCRSPDPRDNRTRCACLVESDGVHVVIDVGPDFRRQALREELTRVDAVLLTHNHFDHVVGLDDLRPFFFDNPTPIPCYAREDTAAIVRRMFDYIFADGSYPGVPKLELHEIDGPFDVHSRYETGRALHVVPVEAYHGRLPLYGYRIGDFAYLTDVSLIPESSFALLEGLDALVLDALRHEPHRSHFTIDEAIEAAHRIGARETYFIHMTHSILHAEEEAYLPPGMHLAYDGLTLELADRQ